MLQVACEQDMLKDKLIDNMNLINDILSNLCLKKHKQAQQRWMSVFF